jgi:dihydroorotate dehydrogenase electron transfer subunit
MTAGTSTPPHAARIARKITENAKTISLILDTAMPAAPGQFAMLWLPGVDEKPFSIAGRDPLTFTIAKVGPFSQALHSLGPGDRLWVRGPFGNGYPIKTAIKTGRALLVGGGYGAAPLHFLALELIAARGKGGALPIIALGARTQADLLFVSRFTSLGLDAHIATEDGSTGMKGRVTDAVRPLLDAGKIGRVYSCGPEAMLEAVASLCTSRGIPAELSYEAYMRCGIGLCGACEHAGRLVCMDGPVFSLPAPPPA